MDHSRTSRRLGFSLSKRSGGAGAVGTSYARKIAPTGDFERRPDRDRSEHRDPDTERWRDRDNDRARRIWRDRRPEDDTPRQGSRDYDRDGWSDDGRGRR